MSTFPLLHGLAIRAQFHLRNRSQLFMALPKAVLSKDGDNKTVASREPVGRAIENIITGRRIQKQLRHRLQLELQRRRLNPLYRRLVRPASSEAGGLPMCLRDRVHMTPFRTR